MNTPPAPIRSAFTLIELMVVVSIVAVLAALLLPALEEARNMAQIAACASNHQQTYVATVNYASDFQRKMPLSATRQGVKLNQLNGGAHWSGIGRGGYYGQGMLWAADYLGDAKVLADPGFQRPHNFDDDGTKLYKSPVSRRIVVDKEGDVRMDLLKNSRAVSGTYTYYGYRVNRPVKPNPITRKTGYQYRKLGQKAVPRFMGDVPKWRIITPIMMCVYGGNNNPYMAGHADHDTMNVLYIGGSVKTVTGIRAVERRARKMPGGWGNSFEAAWWFGSERRPHNWWEWATHKGES